MKPKRVMLVSSLLLLLALIGTVQASSVFVIGPSEEVTENVACPKGCQSICGNVSAVGGIIDFYVTDPSENIVLHYENISVANFNVSTPQNGTYIIHVANRLSASNVTATLFYGVNFNIVINEEVRTWHTLATVTTTLSTPSTSVNPWIGPFSQVGYIILSAVAGLLMNLLGVVIRRGYQKYKDGESKTPTVLKQ